MGSWTPQLCFSVYAAPEETLYVFAEEVSKLLRFVRPPSLALAPP